jgi:hypothetical protein
LLEECALERIGDRKTKAGLFDRIATGFLAPLPAEASRDALPFLHA